MSDLNKIFKMSRNEQIADAVNIASRKYGLPEHLIYAVIKQESNGNPNAESNKGASGLMQLMPDTARSLGVTDTANVYQNINAGTKYLKMNIDKFGSVNKGLAAYNAGPGNVIKYGGIPPFKETQDYVKKVMRYAGLTEGSTYERPKQYEDTSVNYAKHFVNLYNEFDSKPTISNMFGIDNDRNDKYNEDWFNNFINK